MSPIPRINTLQILIITLTLLTASAFGDIDQLMQLITGGYGRGFRLEAPLANRFSIATPNFSFGFGLGR